MKGKRGGKMSQTLEEVKKIHVAQVEHHGDKLIIPEGMKIPDVIDLLKRREAYENEPTEVTATFDCFPWDGARALFNVMKRRFGWVSMESIYSFFGTQRPAMMEVEIGVRKVESIPWGRLTLFKEDGFIDTTLAKKGHRYIFQATATVKRKHEQTVKDIYAELREELAKNSIYRGQAVSLKFRDDSTGKPLPMPEVKFVNVEGMSRSMLILPDIVSEILDTNLYTPIQRKQDCKRAGIKTKRGVLMAGDFGVGKTLAAKIAAAMAVEAGMTFIYCKRADEFAEAVEFGLQYDPGIIFCEDIDRVVTGPRTAEMDTILNIIDGIDTKHAELMVVLTTNDVEKINPSIVRPGRLDAVVEIQKPDAKAAERLIRHYGATYLDPTADLSHVSQQFAGFIPAVIEEIVQRSKLSAVKRSKPGSRDIRISEVDLAEAVETMQMQLNLLNPKAKIEDAHTLLISSRKPVDIDQFRDLAQDLLDTANANN
jgi:transitional endoplasmic reticulum ATPase